MGNQFKAPTRQIMGNNVLNTLQPDHNLFKRYDPEKFDMKTFTMDQIMKIKKLDVTVGKKVSVRRFFKVKKEDQLAIQQKRKEEVKQRLKKQVARKTKAIVLTQQEIQVINSKIQSI